MSQVPATAGELIAYLQQFDPSDKVWMLSQRPKPKVEPETVE